MSVGEFNHWVAYDRVEGPIGDRRGDRQAAAVAHVVAAANVGRGQQAPTLEKLVEFISPPPPIPEKERPKTLRKKMFAALASMGLMKGGTHGRN